jgi:hypothetical protein
MAGVWANFAQVSHSEYEFTLDFVRLDFSTQPPNGIVVARVSVPGTFVVLFLFCHSGLRIGGLVTRIYCSGACRSRAYRRRRRNGVAA